MTNPAKQLIAKWKNGDYNNNQEEIEALESAISEALTDQENKLKDICTTAVVDIVTRSHGQFFVSEIYDTIKTIKV
jgi:hypothetical protein